MDPEQETFSDWEEDDNEVENIFSLFSTFTSSDIADVLKHDVENFNFNIQEIAPKFCVDEVDLIKLINFIRKKVQEKTQVGKSIDADFIDALKWSISGDEFMAEDNLKPTMENDTMLCLLEDIMDFGDIEDDDNNNVHNNANYHKDKLIQQGYDMSKVSNYEAIAADLSVPLTGKSAKKTAVASSSSNDPRATGDDSDSDSESEPGDGYYFESYAHLGIHETMLRDSSRTLTYGNSLLKNPEYVKDKLVIDVGCGTGILSMFACRAGAMHVVGIDLSNIIKQTRLIVEDNGYGEKITLIQGRVEDICCDQFISMLKNKSVDSFDNKLIEALNTYLPQCTGIIIVSEWMGYGLYFENMLSSVIVLRTFVAKYASEILSLHPQVAMFPHTAVLFIEGIDAEGDNRVRSSSLPPVPPADSTAAAALITCNTTDDRVDYWSDVYGFNMSRMKSLFIKEAAVQGIESVSWLRSTRDTFHTLNCMEAVDADLDFIRPFVVNPLNDKCADLRAFNISFDVIFDSPGVQEVMTLSTTADKQMTHWKQTVCWLSPENYVTDFNKTRGDYIRGQVTYLRHLENQRDYDIILEWNVVRGDVGETEKQAKFFTNKQLFSLSSA